MIIASNKIQGTYRVYVNRPPPHKASLHNFDPMTDNEAILASLQAELEASFVTTCRENTAELTIKSYKGVMSRACKFFREMNYDVFDDGDVNFNLSKIKFAHLAAFFAKHSVHESLRARLSHFEMLLFITSLKQRFRCLEIFTSSRRVLFQPLAKNVKKHRMKVWQNRMLGAKLI